MCAVDSKFPRASFPPGEICAERQDYIRRASLTVSPVCTQTMTGSLLFRSPHRLVRGSSCSTLFLPRWTDELEDIPVCGRWTNVRWQNVHASLLVTFDYCFFSSDLIRNRLGFCRYRLCVIYPGTHASVLLYYLVVARFTRIGVPLFHRYQIVSRGGDSCGLTRNIYAMVAFLSGGNG